MGYMDVIAGWFLDEQVEWDARKSCNDQAASIIAALEQAGYCIVPMEPDEWMLGAGENAMISFGLNPNRDDGFAYSGARPCWAEMVKFRPGSPARPAPEIPPDTGHQKREED